MIDYTYKDLFYVDSTKKHITIVDDDNTVEITNSEMYADGIELTESLCSEDELTLGCCEASVLKFKVAESSRSIKDKWLTVSYVLDNHTEEPFVLGRYKVFSDKPSGDLNYRIVTAYDAMYDILNADATAVADWYNGLEFPLSLKDFRDSFFELLDIEQETQVLINDDMEIPKTINVDKLSGKQVITSICEINGVFGHINREGKFAYIKLRTGIAGLYPSDTLYPDDELYPIDASGTQTIDRSHYISCDYEDFLTGYITKINVLDDENTVSLTVGTGNNAYNIVNNILLYQDYEDILPHVQRLIESVRNTNYRPFTATVVGNPCVEVGDGVKLRTRKQIVESYVLTRILRGGQALFDDIETKGVYRYTDNSNSLREQVNQVSGRVTSVSRDLVSLDERTSTRFEQTDDSINLLVETKVDSGTVSTSLSAESEGITITGQRLVVDTDYWDLEADGTQKVMDGNGNVVVEIGQNGITLSGGAKLINSNGVATNLTYTSGGTPSVMGWFGGYGSYTRYGITIQMLLPPSSKFVIDTAVLTLMTTGSNWTGEVVATGGVKTVKAFIGSGMPYIEGRVLSEYHFANVSSGTQIVSGNFTSAGFNGSSNPNTTLTHSTGNIKTVLQSLQHSTQNKVYALNIYGDNVTPSSETDMAQRTGSGIATLNIIGYTKV